MTDQFFTKTTCDRCGRSLANGRIMSMFDESCICMTCAKEERKRSDYKIAADAELAALKRGDRNFSGIGWTPLS